MKRAGVCPRVLVSDGAGEIIETKLRRQLLARSCKHQVAARGAHHDNGPAERVVQEIDTMMRASIVSSGIPMREWCFVTEHMSLVDTMTSYSTSDKSKTIFEAVFGFVPDVDSLSPIGCFACRLEETKGKSDRKLGIQNTPGTMTIYSTSDKSKTIFEAVYGFVPDVDSLPPIGCFAWRLEETKGKSDRKLGIQNTPGTFVGFATLKNCFGGDRPLQ